MSGVVPQAQQYLARVLQTQGLAPPLGSSLTVTTYNTAEAHRRPAVLDWAAVQAQYDHEQFLRDGVQVWPEPTSQPSRLARALLRSVRGARVIRASRRPSRLVSVAESERRQSRIQCFTDG